MLNLLNDYANLIQNETIREDTQRLLNLPEVQQAFKYPSSISGLYHPQDEKGEYGLLLHTLRVCNVAIQLYRSVEDYSNNPIAYDILIASSLLHDVPYKYIGDSSNRQHAKDNALWFGENTNLIGEFRDKIATCLYYHMGRWDLHSHTDYNIFPNNLLAWTIHQVDNLVSRANIFVDVNSVEYLRSNLQ